MKVPGPSLILSELGPHALTFSLRVWTQALRKISQNYAATSIFLFWNALRKEKL